MRRLGRWTLLCALALPPAAVGLALGLCDEAQASVSIAVTLDYLVSQSTAACVVTPFEARTVWENERIYTYSHVHCDTPVGGSLGAGADAWVRTMGGIVGRVGQVVDGEASLTLGRPSLLFLRPLPASESPGGFDVAGRAQGQYAIRLDEKQKPRLVQSASAGGVVAPRPGAATPLATDVLHQRPLGDAARDITAAWGRLHAH
jgi:uncharacterized membrane protein YqaE (UPF0057 family)